MFSLFGRCFNKWPVFRIVASGLKEMLSTPCIGLFPCPVSVNTQYKFINYFALPNTWMGKH